MYKVTVENGIQTIWTEVREEDLESLPLHQWCEVKQLILKSQTEIVQDKCVLKQITESLEYIKTQNSLILEKLEKRPKKLTPWPDLE